MSFVSHYRTSSRPDASVDNRTSRERLAAMARAGAGVTVVVALVGTMAALVALVDPHSRVHTRAWREGLVTTLGQPVARCVNFRMSQRVSDHEMEATLVRTGGDLSRDDRLAGLLALSVARCRAQSLLAVP